MLKTYYYLPNVYDGDYTYNGEDYKLSSDREYDSSIEIDINPSFVYAVSDANDALDKAERELKEEINRGLKRKERKDLFIGAASRSDKDALLIQGGWERVGTSQYVKKHYDGTVSDRVFKMHEAFSILKAEVLEPTPVTIPEPMMKNWWRCTNCTSPNPPTSDVCTCGIRM